MPAEQEPAQSVFTTRILQETETSITVEVTHPTEVVVFTYTPPHKVIVEFPAVSSEDVPATGQAPETEKPKPVKLRGRIGTEIRRKASPTGGEMAVFSFAEHPNRAIWSYSNTLPNKPEKDTIWWPVAAFDTDVALLDGVVKGREYDIECFPNTWKETKDGREIIVNGLRLVGMQPFARRTRQEPPK